MCNSMPFIRLQSAYLYSTSYLVQRHHPCHGLLYFTFTFKNRRSFSFEPLFFPPAIFTGLVLTLWAYKCIMMVVFQNKIIYMPSIPPFSRAEKLIEYATLCNPVQWNEQHIEASDGTRIALAVGAMPNLRTCEGTVKRVHIVIVYFQGLVVDPGRKVHVY